MGKKSIVLLIIIFVIGFTIFTQIYHGNDVQVGEITFSLPEDYHEVNSTNTKVTITNNFNTLFISKCDDINITNNINEYKKIKQKENTSMKINTFKIDDTIVYKSNLINDTNSVHYWFTINNKTYTIYTWDANRNIDSVVHELIKSIK